MGWLREKLRLAKIILLSLKIEPFIFLFVLSTNLSEITRSQLIQDKLCLNNYNQSRQFCIELKESQTDGGEDEIVNSILGELATFSSYIQIISTLPGFFYVLFIGSWIDQYIHGRRIILCVGMLGYAGWYSLQLLNAIYFDWNVYYFFLAYIPVSLVGGWACVWMVGYSYMSTNTKPKYKFIKFVSFEIAMFSAGPTGIYLGGKLLGTGNYGTTGSLHNYERVFVVSTVCAILAFFWVLIVINEGRKKNSDVKMADINVNQDIDDKNEEPSDKFRISKLFDLNNLKDMMRTALQKRANRGRLQIWLLIGSMCMLMMSDVKFLQIIFPYVEKMYEWDAKHFSDIKSLSSIVQILTMIIIPPFLSNYLRLGESLLGIIGFTSIFLCDLAIGSIINPLGIYLMYAMGSVSGIASISIRSLLSNIASKQESGRIFALLGALEQIVPTIQALFYNIVFAQTIDWYPSLSFQIGAAFNFLPIFIFMWIDLTRAQSSPEQSSQSEPSKVDECS